MQVKMRREAVKQPWGSPALVGGGEEKKQMPLGGDRGPSEPGTPEAMAKEGFQEGHCDWLC